MSSEENKDMVRQERGSLCSDAREQRLEFRRSVLPNPRGDPQATDILEMAK